METKKTKSLRVGNPTKEKTPVAAIIAINGMFGLEKYFFQGDSPEDIINGVERYQDLHCLCNMAQEMGEEEDVTIAKKLERFLASSYKIEDFNKFDYPLSIGSIRCMGWAKGENNCEILEAIYEEEKKD